MADYKRQHYVPRFYLKYFSNHNDKKSIGIYNLKSSKYIPNGSLKEQAYIDYFYGKDGHIESILKEMEDLTAKIFPKIIDNISCPSFGSENYAILLTFIIFLAARTKFAADAADDFLDKTIKTIYKRDPRVKDFLKEVVIKYNNAPAFVLSVTSQILPIAFDLHIILLQNNTNTKFITSDNPVVKYNQFLEHRNTVGSNVGLSTKGLQIFFPLTPDFCILFYDITVYKIGNRKQTVIIVSDTNDIDQLNKLQIINAYNNVFFNEQITKEYIEKLISQSKHYFRKETSRIKEIPLYQDSNGGLALL